MVTDNTSQADDTTAFLRAARSGNLEKVIEFLDTDLDINTANSNGLNALHLASKDGHVEIVTELLKRGAKVDAATKKGNTALHIASLAGQAEIVNILIQYGAAVNIQSQNGFTPLYMAAQENHDQVVKLLLGNGANQSLATEDGFTPLAVAMQQGHDKVVSVLLENDSKGKVRLPALHIAAKKDDCKAADLLLQNDHKPDVTSKSGFTPLHIAAHYGNEEIARLLIKRGADVNYLAKHNISPLHVAAKWGKNNMVKVLLENSAQIDAKTRDGLTPLHCAARSGHEQVVTTLLENSAPISARTKNGLAPLHMASQGDHVDAARVLLYHRAPVDEVTIDYLTSLHVAAHCGHVRVAKLLLDRKADPNARALNGFTPLHIACKKNRIKVVELLLKHGASIESTTESGLTPLHVASFMGCMNIVIFLLQHEANPDVPTVRGETPLHLAARANQTDIIRILLRNGAKVDARAREQQTPLHIASRLGNTDIVMLLLQHGAAVDTTTKDMYTALHIAAKEGQEEVATILVENNASLKATTKNGFTPLHVAAKYGNMNVAKILLQKDSKLDAQGKNDISPLHLACHYDHPNVANLLLEKGASPHLASQNGHTPLHIAARKNQMDIASTLLENGANANAESKAGFTPLHLSAPKGHYDMTNLLIEHGADPNHKAKNGLTALHLCAQEDFIKVASILVKNGADVESQTETGYRPIHVAAHFGNLSMIRFLLKHNADIDVRTNQNYTALHQAAQQGHAHIVSALLEGNASHKARTNDGLTALNIAQKLGYISVMEVLKGLSYDTLTPDNKNWEEKYKVIAPESLQETSFMSDSDDEGGSDALISEQPYRYLTADLMKSLRDDSLPIDVTRDDPIHKQVTKEEKQEFTQSNNYCLAENFDSTDGLNLGRLHFRSFLVSFLVDARGGAMKGCRHSGVRIIVPPRRATMPIRVTCRLVKPSKVPNPPPLMEGEALATRIIEMGPVGATFLGPVLIDIPHFASIRGKEREIIILRSEKGETWKEHDNTVDNDDTLLNTPHDPQMSASHSGRITRIITTDFPQYFAIVTRIKQEVHVIGAEGGILISSVANHVQAVFPPGALTKKIKVGLQAHVIPAELTAKLLGNCVAVSPVITIEPRRRKFHKPITLTIPVPQAANKGMINQYGGETPTLRLLCSIAGGTSESQWEDVTGSTPLTFMNDRVSFTTTVSARFWLMDCRNIGAVPKMATELYEESLFVPYITNFVIYSKRMDILEATLRILCMTDGKEGMHTLEKQEEFLEIVKSRDVEALDGKDLYIEFSGNLIPVTKSGVQLKFTFKAFRQNRLSFHVKVKDPLLDPVARMLFMREPKVAKGELPQQPICVLNIVLPEIMTKMEAEKKLKDYEDSNIISQKMDFYETKYKLEQKEKCDEPKETSPSERKFITDTLQKEQTDAATIHESLAQKAASCPLESVDASYPTKLGGQEEQGAVSPSAEKQTYSEKRKFWEDISRKRESYARSESEVSRTSQLTINESDSECQQNVASEEDGTELASTDVVGRSETMEDLNVPDISECSVAEKAHYFEEQIQKEMAKVPLKTQQQEPVKGEKEKEKEKRRSYEERTEVRETMEREEKHVMESRQGEKLAEGKEEESREMKWTERKEESFERKEDKRKKEEERRDEKDEDESKEVCRVEERRIGEVWKEMGEERGMEVEVKEEKVKEEVRKKVEEEIVSKEVKKEVEKKEEKVEEKIVSKEEKKEVEKKEEKVEEVIVSKEEKKEVEKKEEKVEEKKEKVEEKIVSKEEKKEVEKKKEMVEEKKEKVEEKIVLKEEKKEIEKKEEKVEEKIVSKEEKKEVEKKEEKVEEKIVSKEEKKEVLEMKKKVDGPGETLEDIIKERKDLSGKVKEYLDDILTEETMGLPEEDRRAAEEAARKEEAMEKMVKEIVVERKEPEKMVETIEEKIERKTVGEKHEEIVKTVEEQKIETTKIKEEVVKVEKDQPEVSKKVEDIPKHKEEPSKPQKEEKPMEEPRKEEKEKEPMKVTEPVKAIQKEVVEIKEEIVKVSRDQPEKVVEHVQEKVVSETKPQKLVEEVHVETSPVAKKRSEMTKVTEEIVSEVKERPEERSRERQELTEVSTVERSGTPEGKRSGGRRIITEETTIIYKVQKDGTLVQEQVLKSVQIEGANGVPVTQIPEVSVETKIYEKGLPETTVYEIQSSSDIKTDLPLSEVKKEIQQFLETERRLHETDVEGSVTEEIKQKTEEVARIVEKVSTTEESPLRKVEETTIESLERKEEVKAEADAKPTKKEFESRIPISTAKADKEKLQKEAKSKGQPEAKQLPDKPDNGKAVTAESPDVTSPTSKKKEFESRIPKRVVDTKPTDKTVKKDSHGKKENETYTVTEKKSSEEVTSKHEEHSTMKSATQTFSKTFTDPQEAFKMFEDMDSMKKDFTTVTSKVDHKSSSKSEKKEVVSSEISKGAEKIITHEEKERVESKKSSESKLKKESPAETLEEKKSKHEEVDRTAVQKLSMNLSDGQEVIDASASESRVESKKDETFKMLEDQDGVTTHEIGSTRTRESDADVAIRVKNEAERMEGDTKTVEDFGEKVSRAFVDADKIELIAQGESRRETRESFDVMQFVPSRKSTEDTEVSEESEVTSEEKKEEAPRRPKTLEELQTQKFKEIEARTIAETLLQSIESEIEKKSTEQLRSEYLGKGYLDQLMSDGMETDHEKLADDLTRKFEMIMKKSMDRGDLSLTDSSRLKSSLQEEYLEKGSTRDSISISEDITKDEESSPRDKEDSLPLSSSQARLQERDITMSPSSISEQIDFEETMDVDTNELEDLSKGPSTPQSEKLRSDRSSGQVEPIQRDPYSDASFAKDKVVSEISGARVLEILEPGAGSQSRQDSVDVTSLEMDEQKVSETTSKDIPSLRESVAVDSLERIADERDITISPSTVSEDTNIDSSLMHEHPPPIVIPKDPEVGMKRADSFEIESPPMVSPRSKVHGLEIKPVHWMIGDEKIEISETLQPSQVFNQELEAYESSMREQGRLPSQDGSTDMDQESVTKSSEDTSVIESVKETVSQETRVTTSVTRTTKFTVIPVSEQDLESELIENKLDVSCQELVDRLQREYDAKTPTEEYAESIRQGGLKVMESEEESVFEDQKQETPEKEVAEIRAESVDEKDSPRHGAEESKESVVEKEPVEVSRKSKVDEEKQPVVVEEEREKVVALEEERSKPLVSKEEKIEEKEKDDVHEKEKEEEHEKERARGEQALEVKEGEFKVSMMEKKEEEKRVSVTEGEQEEKKVSVTREKDEEKVSVREEQEERKVSISKEEEKEVSISKEDEEKGSMSEEMEKEVSVSKETEEKVSDRGELEKEVSISKEVEKEVSESKEEEKKVSESKEEEKKVSESKEEEKKVSERKEEEKKVSESKEEEKKVTESKEEEKKVTESKEDGKKVSEGEETREKSMKEEKPKATEVVSKPDVELKLGMTLRPSTDEEMSDVTFEQATETDISKIVRVDDLLKEWTEAYLSKLKPLSEEYKRHIEKKQERRGRSTAVPSDTSAFKLKKDDLPSVDLCVLDQVVQKEIAEVKESLEAAKQDLIEELSENSETVFQIKDSPSEFQFKLQPESIPNYLPFLYRPPSPEHASIDREQEPPKSESPVAKPRRHEATSRHEGDEVSESSVKIEETPFSSIETEEERSTQESRTATPAIETEKSEVETTIAVHEDTRDDEEERPSPRPASRSGSDVDNKDESSSLALPQPVPRRRQKPTRSSKRIVTSESEAEIGSSSGESSNYQSCDYEYGSGSRPSSSDVEAMQSCGPPSATTSEYETAMMSVEHSAASKPTSQDYHTAVSTLSSRESMKSLNSLSSGHLGSIDSTSELSETLVPSEADADKEEEIEENLECALDEERGDQSDSSGSEIPIDEAVDKIDSHIPCRMKRSSEMIFQQIIDDDATLDMEPMEEPLEEESKRMEDSSTSAFTMTSGAVQSVDIMTSRVSEDGIQSVCTQVISKQATIESETHGTDTEDGDLGVEKTEKGQESMDGQMEPDSLEPGSSASGVASDSPEMTVQTSVLSMMQQASMSTSSTSGMSVDTVIEKEKSDRHSPDSDSFELVDKPDIIDDFVVIEEVGREAEEYDSEGKSIRISSLPQVSSKNYDRDLENLITDNKDDSQVSTSQATRNNELFDFESEESPPQASNDDQYSQSYSDEEQYEGGKKWIEMQFQADTRVYDIEYDRGPLEDIKEEEITDFEAGSSRFGSLGSHKESIGSVGSMRGSFGSTPDYDVLAGKKYFTRPTDHDNVSLSSLQEFENLESAVAAENSKRLQCGSQDSVNNGSLPRRYMTSRSGHGDDISLSSLKDFEGLEKACREAHLIELRAREEEDLLEHESPENRYKLENLPRTRAETSAAGSFNPSTSGSDDYEKRIKEIDEIIRIAQSNVEKFDRQDDTTEDISQIEITDVEKGAGSQIAVQPLPEQQEEETDDAQQPQKDGNIMETSTDSLELEDNVDKKHHPLCRSSDSLEMKTTLDFPSLSSDSLNNVRDARETQSEQASNIRRISSDSLDMPLLEQQDVEAQQRDSESSNNHSERVTTDNSLGQTTSTETNVKNGKTKTMESSGT